MLEEDDYWKDHLYEYFRRHVFLSVGLSPESLINDIAPYLRKLDKWYLREKVSRNMPYGFAFVSMDTTGDQQAQLLEHGIVSCKFEHKDVPEAVFKIAENALSVGRGK